MDYEISDDPRRLDLDVAHRYLAGESYWAAGIPREVFDRAVANSLCVGAYLAGEMVGFARAVTDRATFVWLCDVFVLAEHRGNGIATELVRAVHEHPELRGVRRLMLATADAHPLYRGFGYRPANPDVVMEISHPPRELYGPAVTGPAPPAPTR